MGTCLVKTPQITARENFQTDIKIDFVQIKTVL